MELNEISVLIPSHGLEDFPMELEETEAAGLLNAFSVVWHPQLIAKMSQLPGWERADDPPRPREGSLFLLPTASEEWLSHGWLDRARKKGAIVVEGIHDRDELASALLNATGVDDPLDSDLVRDFFALGSCWLQLELLSRQMHYFVSPDESILQREAVLAAEAILSGDEDTTRHHLKACFEQLTETREQMYPVDCHLLDLCLLTPELVDEKFDQILKESHPVNILCSPNELQKIAASRPEAIVKMQECWAEDQIDLIGGEYRETPSALLPIESVLWEFRHGHHVLNEMFGGVPKVWGRRRFGLSTLLPLVLDRFGYELALHYAMDDGFYPEAESSKTRWEGCDGTGIDAVSRIPMAANSATSYLKFAHRMAESMEGDQVAGMILARWPQQVSPWFDDFRRMASYSPSLGKFATFTEFTETTEDAHHHYLWDAREYMSPFLSQAVARKELNPVSRYRRHWIRRYRFFASEWASVMASALLARFPAIGNAEGLEQQIELAGCEGEESLQSAADEDLERFAKTAGRKLASVILGQSGKKLPETSDSPGGLLIVNPLSFPRRIHVDISSFSVPPAIRGPVKMVQFDKAFKVADVEVPGSGFAWLPAGGSQTSYGISNDVWLADRELLQLRNEFFEVHINPTTGGISRIKEYGRKPNRLSQQLAFRFPSERLIPGEDEGRNENRSYYSEMRCRNIEVTSTGPAVGEIVSDGDLIDQMDDSRIAGFRQKVRVRRGQPFVELGIEIDTEILPKGNPWSNYFTSRFAWNDITATLTRSIQQGAQSFFGDRIESPDYIEIAEGQERITILNGGLPFHRKTGPRMLDTILLTEGETARRFRLSIAFDHPYPQEAALDRTSPPLVIPTGATPPPTGESGWFFHHNARNVQILRIDDLAANRNLVKPDKSTNGLTIRFAETEGRSREFRFRCYRSPVEAKTVDFNGQTITPLAIESDTIRISMSPYEIVDVEIRF